MQKKQRRITFLLLFTLFILISVFSVSILTPGVSGANTSTIKTYVNVTNNEPTIYNVTLSPTPLNLNPGINTTWNCTGLVYDRNGWNDVNITNATLYHISSTNDALDDNNFHYTANIDQCNCTSYLDSATNASCTCQFNMTYYANNGTWTCNMSVRDEYGLRDSLTGSGTINPFIAINLPSEVDYGNLSVTETSEEKIVTINNYGNLPINISVYGYGGDNQTEFNNTAMMCPVGNISISYERFSIEPGTAFNNMTNLTSTSQQIANLTLPQRVNDTSLGQDTNNTYWRLYVPSGVTGYCNGTLVFEASSSDFS